MMVMVIFTSLELPCPPYKLASEGVTDLIVRAVKQRFLLNSTIFDPLVFHLDQVLLQPDVPRCVAHPTSLPRRVRCMFSKQAALCL